MWLYREHNYAENIGDYLGFYSMFPVHISEFVGIKATAAHISTDPTNFMNLASVRQPDELVVFKTSSKNLPQRDPLQLFGNQGP